MRFVQVELELRLGQHVLDPEGKELLAQIRRPVRLRAGLESTPWRGR